MDGSSVLMGHEYLDCAVHFVGEEDASFELARKEAVPAVHVGMLA